MMFTIVCTRCNTKIHGRDEREAEAKVSNHTCPNMRDLEEMPFDLLRQVAYGNLSEPEAWAIVDSKT